MHDDPASFERALRDTGAPEARIDGYYLPVLRFVARAIERSPRRPALVGVSGPQGSGKSTLVEHLRGALERLGQRAVAVSIDDFYLTRAEQIALASEHPGNRFLEHRGYPGTHDVGLGVATLEALASREDDVVMVPRYDKGAHEGRGDRAPREAFSRVETPLDVILLEGWLVGFAPLALGPDADPSFAEANRRLAPYRAWTERLDALVLLHVADLDAIVAYRVDAERARRSATGRGLTDDEARDYIERFLPAYERWVPPLLAGSPIAGPVLCVEIGRDRSPVRPLTGREG